MTIAERLANMGLTDVERDPEGEGGWVACAGCDRVAAQDCARRLRLGHTPLETSTSRDDEGRWYVWAAPRKAERDAS